MRKYSFIPLVICLFLISKSLYSQDEVTIEDIEIFISEKVFNDGSERNKYRIEFKSVLSEKCVYNVFRNVTSTQAGRNNGRVYILDMKEYDTDNIQTVEIKPNYPFLTYSLHLNARNGYNFKFLVWNDIKNVRNTKKVYDALVALGEKCKEDDELF